MNRSTVPPVPPVELVGVQRRWQLKRRHTGRLVDRSNQPIVAWPLILRIDHIKEKETKSPLCGSQKVGLVDEKQASPFAFPGALFTLCPFDVLDVRF